MRGSNVLVVCGKTELAKEIALLMCNSGHSGIEIALSANEARRKINQIEPEVIIINSPLVDEDTSSFVLGITEIIDACIIVIVRREMLFDMQEDLKKTNSLILSRPLDKTTLLQTVRFACNIKKSIENLKSENSMLKKKMDDIKIIDKSKWYLVENLNMNEQQAHRYIQKRAMDLRLPLVDVAIEIIKSYE